MTNEELMIEARFAFLKGQPDQQQVNDNGSNLLIDDAFSTPLTNVKPLSPRAIE